MTTSHFGNKSMKISLRKDPKGSCFETGMKNFLKTIKIFQRFGGGIKWKLFKIYEDKKFKRKSRLAVIKVVQKVINSCGIEIEYSLLIKTEYLNR